MKKASKKKPAKPAKKAKPAPKRMSGKLTDHLPMGVIDAPPFPAVNVMTDRAGTVFDPAKHAATADGTPHADSAGKFILKEHHYDGAKKAHYGDSYRHA
jgi:hypothetical protein